MPEMAISVSAIDKMESLHLFIPHGYPPGLVKIEVISDNPLARQLRLHG
jgi:hypothetical protein